MISFVYGSNPNDLIAKLNERKDCDVITIVSGVRDGYLAFIKIK